MNCETKHNGWSTYETWLVALWLDNEWRTYHAWREIAFQCWKAAPESERVKQWNWLRHDAAAVELAELLDNAVREESPVDKAGMYSDLLNAALSDVDWREIATNLLSEVTKEEVFKEGGNTP